jgi:hypothetical protein
MLSSDRFFSATVVAGRLHILGLPRGGPWDPARLEWREASEVDTLVNPRAGDRKISTREGLQAIMTPSATPSRFLWIHESLVGEARRLWEETDPARSNGVLEL